MSYWYDTDDTYSIDHDYDSDSDEWNVHDSGSSIYKSNIYNIDKKGFILSILGHSKRIFNKRK
jgi:hypothetical protein